MPVSRTPTLMLNRLIKPTGAPSRQPFPNQHQCWEKPMPDIATVTALIEKQGEAFEAFKAEHNAALDDIRKGTEDVVRTEKVDRINDEIGKLTAALDDANTKI